MRRPCDRDVAVMGGPAKDGNGTEGPEITRPRFTALVLAGRRSTDDPVAAMRGVSHKFLADVAGRPMLARVLDSLAASESVGRILVCTDETAALPSLLPSGVETVAAAASPSRSILAGTGQTSGRERGGPYVGI